MANNNMYLFTWFVNAVMCLKISINRNLSIFDFILKFLVPLGAVSRVLSISLHNLEMLQ